ncbi:TPA: DNA cytosine methyltransferase [Vibrio parahaemolyticus]|nr:DNA cytosine methyltransferase [Vibrio parahaemolyticus]
MATIVNTKLGEHRGKKRVWLEGAKLAREGYEPGQKYDLVLKDSQVVIRVCDTGKFTVSKRTRNGRTMPIIDVSSQELAELFDGVEMLRVFIRQGTIVISAHHQHERVVERVERLFTKLENGEPLSVCSLFHGGGVLDKALHSGLSLSGIASSVAVAVEMEPKYLDASLRNNTELWNDKSIVIESPIQAINLSRQPPQVDLLVGGIPCTGASKAGRSKNKLWGNEAGGHAESHESAGALFFNFLQFVDALNPAIVIIENVPEYSSTASMEVIRSVMASLGYTIQERILDGNEFGVLERRKRLCVVGTSVGIDTFDINNVMPLRQKESCIRDILEPVPLDSPRWKSFDYLAEKEKRDKAAGKGFTRQLLTGDEPFLGTIGRDYAKCRSTEPFIVHPEQPELSRILTPIEHCYVKGIPTKVIEGESDTTAHQILGQSVVFPAFEAIAYELGRSCWKMLDKTPVQVEVVNSDQSCIDGGDFHWAPALIEQTGTLKLAPTGQALGMPINVMNNSVYFAAADGPDTSCGHQPAKSIPIQMAGDEIRVMAA